MLASFHNSVSAVVSAHMTIHRISSLPVSPRPLAGVGVNVHRLPSDDPGDQDEPV